MTKIEELKAAFEAAKHDGPLSSELNISKEDSLWIGSEDSYFAEVTQPGSGLFDADEATATFIALAHNLMPQLLEAVEVLKQIKALLDDHPQAAVGNTKVHVVVCKATGALNAFKEDFA